MFFVSHLLKNKLLPDSLLWMRIHSLQVLMASYAYQSIKSNADTMALKAKSNLLILQSIRQ